MTIGELKQWLDEQYDDRDYIAYSLWTMGDVYNCAEDEELPVPDSEVASRILADMQGHHDCDQGLTWDVLKFHMYEHWDADAGQWKE